MEHERLVNGLLPFTPLSSLGRASVAGVYALYCTQSQQVYIGSAVGDIQHRIKQHLYDAQRGKHANKPLESLLLSGTIEPGVVEVVQGSAADIRQREGFWIAQLQDTGLLINQAPVRIASGPKVQRDVRLKLDRDLYEFVADQAATYGGNWAAYAELVFRAIQQARAGNPALLNGLTGATAQAENKQKSDVQRIADYLDENPELVIRSAEGIQLRRGARPRILEEALGISRIEVSDIERFDVAIAEALNLRKGAF